MRHFCIIILLSVSIIKSYSQEVESEKSECANGKKKALIDFSNGIYYYENYIGITSQKKDIEFE